ncbi:MAG: 23S rRNA (guanosine(2251)-2'-O)-methyltransferase RlmB [Hyphomicrobium sp.]
MKPYRKFQRPARPAASGPARYETGGGDGPLRLFGVHPVEAALHNPARTIKRLLATENGEHRLAGPIGARGIAVERASPRDLDRLLGADTVHQGVMLETEPLEEPGLEELTERAMRGGPIVVLDHVTDPHNVGAVLRSAAVFGASGMIMTRRHSPPLNGVLAKAASGALELVPVLLVQNLAKTLGELKAQRIRIVGLDGGAERRLEDEPFEGAIALVLGAEGKGLRQLTAETCDALLRIGATGPLASLNVSNAAAVALHLSAMRRGLENAPEVVGAHTGSAQGNRIWT